VEAPVALMFAVRESWVARVCHWQNWAPIEARQAASVSAGAARHGSACSRSRLIASCQALRLLSAPCPLAISAEAHCCYRGKRFVIAAA
jgi:hypothetical protein